MNYRWNAKRRHGVHSPFVYELTDKCFQTKIDDTLKLNLSRLHDRLARNRKTIEIKDFGAGSKRLGTSRKISSIYKTSSSKGKYSRMLYQLANYYAPDNCLELGTSLGIGTTCLAAGNPKGIVTTIEGCPQTWLEAKSNFEFLGIENIRSINEVFDTALTSFDSIKFDLIYIDGHHDGDALLRYVNRLIENAHDDTFFILDDIRWSSSMKSAWETIVSDPRFHVTIDLFRMGIVLLRPQQEKEHFTIRL